MGIASTFGTITVLDTQSKRTFFQDKTAHKSPCPDIAWSATKPDTLVTVGYDCTLNIYDLRRKTVVTQTRNEHPYSTVCLSACGLYCCAGNLKGDVISYDFRNLKEPLACKRTHDTNVIRVAFVPPQLKSDKRITFYTAAEPISPDIQNKVDTAVAPVNERAAKRRDSFNDLIDMCCMVTPAIVVPPKKDVKKNRDSFLDIDVGESDSEQLSTNNVNLTDFPHPSSNRYSELRLKRTSKSRASLTPNLSTVKQSDGEEDSSSKLSNQDDVFENKNNSLLVTSKINLSIVGGGRKRSNIKRMAMGPDDIIKSQIRGNLANVDETNTESRILQESKSFNKIPSTNCVTFTDQITTPIKNAPNHADELANKENHKDVEIFGKFLHHEINGASSSTPNHEQMSRNLHHSVTELNDDLRRGNCSNSCSIKIAALERSIDQRFDRLYTMISDSEARIKSAIDSMHLSLQFNMWSMQDTDVADVRDMVQQLLANENLKKHYASSGKGNNLN